MCPCETADQGSGIQMANHLTLDGVRPLGPSALGTPILLCVLRSFKPLPFPYNCQEWMGWFMGKDWGHSPHHQIRDANMAGIGSYLKKHTEALVKDVGIEPACVLTGKSKATLGRYYSDSEEHADRFMPVDAVAQLEAAASYPHVTSALAELHGATLNKDNTPKNSDGGINSDVIALSHRFAMLMTEYQQSIEDGVITVNEAKRLLRETVELQKVLIDMKLHLEDEA